METPQLDTDKLHKALTDLVAVLDDYEVTFQEAINLGVLFFGKIIGIAVTEETKIEDFIKSSVVRPLINIAITANQEREGILGSHPEEE